MGIYPYFSKRTHHSLVMFYHQAMVCAFAKIRVITHKFRRIYGKYPYFSKRTCHSQVRQR